MLDNTITLSVDKLNTGSPTDVIFTRYEEFQNRSMYKSPDHSLISRDTLGFYRTMPKKSGNFNGVAKSSLKFTIDKTVDGVDTTTENVAPQIGEISFSLPIGFSAAEAMELRQRMIAALDDDDLLAALSEDLEV